MAGLRTRRADASGGTASDDTPLKTRAETLIEAATMARRGAKTLIAAEQSRARTVAGLSAAGGAVALVLAGIASTGLAAAPFCSVLAGIAALIPTAFALSKAAGSDETDAMMAQVHVEQNACQGIAVNARRLSDSLAAATKDPSAVTPSDIVNGQFDALFADLDRARQHLAAAGVDVGVQRIPAGLNERIVPTQTETVIVIPDGRRFPVYIADLSQTDIKVRGVMPRLGLNDTVQVGSRKARLRSLVSNRAAFQFVNPIALAELNPKIVV